MGCTISANKLSGVFVRDGGNAVLRGNTVSGNGDYGVALQVGGKVGGRWAWGFEPGSATTKPPTLTLSATATTTQQPARQDGCTARLFDNKVAANGVGSVQIHVGSVAVDVGEVTARNTLDTPAAALML
jgi:parallel beta-helix repeat protein